MELNPEVKPFTPVLYTNSPKIIFEESIKYDESILKLNEHIINYIDKIIDDKEWNKKNYKIEE